MTNLEINAAYIGSTEVTHMYLGDELVWRSEPEPPGPDYSAMPLTFEILSAGTIMWWQNGGSTSDAKTIEYKKNDDTWVSITSSSNPSKAPTFSVQPGDIVLFKGTNIRYNNGGIPSVFSGTCSFNAYGNILSLIYGDNYLNETELPSGNTSTSNFDGLFRQNMGIIDASNIIMPQNTTRYCFKQMFYYCENLEKAPTLPAATLAIRAYNQMFDNCHKLNYVKCLATDISASDCTVNWLNQVAATGTFVKNPNMSSWTGGIDGIPAGWTVQDAII